jgi:predicted deacylase
MAYGLGYIIRQEAGPERAVAGTSSGAAAQAGIPAITAEAGGCGIVERWAVDAHLRGLDAVLAQLGMATPVATNGTGRTPALLSRFLWQRCARGGWWEPTAAAGEVVREGQVLGTVSSLDGSVEQETITATADGVIIFLTSSPAVADDGLLLGLGADGTTFFTHRELPGNASGACPSRTDVRRRPRG